MKIRLLGALTHCFKSTVAFTLSTVICSGISVAQVTDEFSWLVDDVKRIQKNSQSIVGEQWLSQAQVLQPEAIKHAQTIREGVIKANPLLSAAQEQAEPFKTDEIYQNLLFISYSLGEIALKEVLETASQDQSIALIMRGIPEGMDIWGGMAQLQRLAAEYDPMPNIVLDPTLFEKYQVDIVPTLIFLEKDELELEPLSREELDKLYNPLNPNYETPNQELGGAEQGQPKSVLLKEIARVSGLTDPEWIKRQIKQNQKGNFGIKGPVLEIAERDLIEVMKERVLQVDWEEKKRLAGERFWNNQKFIYLPTNQKEQIHYVDASVTVTRDIITPDGQFIAQAGDTVNPLATRPFTQAIVVFNPAEKKQLHWIRDALPAIEKGKGVKKVVYIATQLDTDDGWEGYEALTNELQAHVFLLTPDVRDRFELRSTPSVITANETHFVVHELFKPEQELNDND